MKNILGIFPIYRLYAPIDFYFRSIKYVIAHPRRPRRDSNLLTERFQIEELEVLAFDLDVFDASIRRANKLVFALDLFQYMQQRDGLGQLLDQGSSRIAPLWTGWPIYAPSKPA